MHLTLPARIGPYIVQRRLGGGGFTEVLLGRDTRHLRNGGLVAIKRLRPGLIHRDPVFLDSLLSEAEIGMSVRDPHLVQVEGVLDDAGEPVVVMEYVQGHRLDALLGVTSEAGVKAEAAAEIARQICDALAALHQVHDASGRLRCVVHQDVKPSNLILTSDGIVKLLDFNLARPAAGELLSLWVRQGTPGYRSPEQSRGDRSLGPASDLYSLGVVLYEMLAGQRLFEEVQGDAERLLERQKQISFLMAVGARRVAPPGLDHILEKLLQFDPAERPSSAAQVQQELAHWQKSWNPEFHLRDYLLELRPALEAYSALSEEPREIHQVDTQIGERLAMPTRDLGTASRIRPPGEPGRSGERSRPASSPRVDVSQLPDAQLRPDAHLRSEAQVRAEAQARGESTVPREAGPRPWLAATRHFFLRLTASWRG